MTAARDRMHAHSAPEWDTAYRDAARARRKAEVKPVAKVVPPLMDFIPKVTPEYRSPLHLAPVVEAFEPIAKGELIELAFSVPPRHAKTTTLLHGVAWLMCQCPGFKVAYLTFDEDRALEVSRDMKRIAERAGLGRGSRWTDANWTTSNECMFRAASLGAGLTGSGWNLVIVDDPYRKRADAESAGVRKKLFASWGADVYTRQDPGRGTSFIVLHTRWHVSDLIAKITDPEYRDGRPFHYVNLPALSEAGALAPWMWDMAWLMGMKGTLTAYEWASQFMGQPRPKGGSVFDPPLLCTLADIPSIGRDSIGVDLGYTAKTSSDWSGYVVLRRVLELYYVVRVMRAQQRTPATQAMLKAAAAMYPGAPMQWHCSGTELGSADLMIEAGVPLQTKSASADKYTRALPAAGAWNNGKILVPRDAPWSPAFIKEVTDFTGIGDDHDDQVDMLATAYSAIRGGGKLPEGGDRKRSMSTARASY